MNKELVKYNGKLAVIDENKSIKEVECLDNICDILSKENLIEELENMKRELECCSKRFNREKIEDFIEIPLPVVATILTPIIMSYLKGLSDVVIVNNGIMTKEKYIALFIGLFTPLSVRISKEWYSEYKEKKENECGRILAIKGLERCIYVQKEELKKIKEMSNLCSIDSFDSENVKMRDDNSLMDISRYINFCYSLGINYKYLLNYYKKNGELSKELIEDCSSEEMQFVKNAVEEKVKNKKNK